MSKKHAKGKASGKARKAKAFYENAYEGARSRKRLANWQPSRASINQMLAADGYVLRARARDLVRNNPYVASAIESFTANLIGSGVKPSPLFDDTKRVKQVMEAWADWISEADYDGLTDFYGMQALVARAMFEAGECFIRYRPADPDSGLVVPLQLQLLESEMLDYNKNHAAENGNYIVNGIEIDKNGKRIAYWFWSVYPGDPRYRAEPLEYIRVPADEVLHIFRPLRPGQMRGAPWITPSVVRLWLLDQFDDAELDRKKKSAMYMGFVTSPAPLDEFLGEDDLDAEGVLPRYSDVPVLETGTMQKLDPGEDVRFSDPAEVGSSYEPFQYRNILAASAGMGVPYMAVTGDVEKANYSSSRQGLVEFRNRLEQLQHTCIVFQMCRPIWQKWLTVGEMCGAFQLPGFALVPRKYFRNKWIPPRFDWIDPLHDLQAEKLAVDNGFKSRSDVILAGGEDPEETDRRISADQERAQKYNLRFSDVPIETLGMTQTPAGSATDPPGNDNKGSGTGAKAKARGLKATSWIGVDLDGTLARYDGWEGDLHIGDPIPSMVSRVKAWIAEGETVKIFTARIAVPEPKCSMVIEAIKNWLEIQGLPRLDVTNVKDLGMKELWDDKSVQIVKNTGEPLAQDHHL